MAGQCTEAGIVTVRIGDRRYEVQSNGNNWSLDLDEPLEAADVVEMWVQAEGKAPSYVVCTSPGLTGSGTETDPYLIETVDDLQAISDLADEECYYKLTADIDLTDYIAANGWMPVVLSGSFRRAGTHHQRLAMQHYEFGRIVPYVGGRMRNQRFESDCRGRC